MGAPFDGTGGSQTGSVFVYKEVSENKWDLFDRKITPLGGKAGDQFGVSVDIDDESTIAIGSSVSAIIVIKTVFYHIVFDALKFWYGFNIHSMQQLMKITNQVQLMCMIYLVCFFWIVRKILS